MKRNPRLRVTINGKEMGPCEGVQLRVIEKPTHNYGDDEYALDITGMVYDSQPIEEHWNRKCITLLVDEVAKLKEEVSRQSMGLAKELHDFKT